MRAVLSALAAFTLLVLAACTEPEPTPTDGTDGASPTTATTTADPTTTGDTQAQSESPSEDDSPTNEGESPEPPADGAWAYSADGDLNSAIVSGPGSTLEFISGGEASSRAAYLRAEEFTWDYLQETLCPISATQYGCATLKATIGDTSIDVIISVPETEDDPKLSAADPLTLWDAIVAGTGEPLVLTATEPESGTEIVFEFATEGADPNFFASGN